MKYKPAEFAFDGQRVLIPWPTPEKPRQGAWVKVACAMGNHVRVVSEALGVDQWRRVDSVYVEDAASQQSSNAQEGDNHGE